jgi:G2/mitotic-specific cyclin 3/4
MTPNPNYMAGQRELNWHMRRVLIDWIVQVHARFRLLPETLFLAVNIIDRFLTLRNVPVDKLQLVGSTALLIASKYEEIICPTVDEVVYMAEKAYTADDVLGAERFMMNMLQFELGWPGPLSFLRRISKADDYDVNTRTLAKYLLEVTLMDERFVASPPSFLAAVAHGLARRMLNQGHWVTYTIEGDLLLD